VSKVYAPHIAIIREAIAAVLRYRPAEKDAFLSDPMAQNAVLMRLQVVGEHLSRMRRIDAGRFAEVADDSWPQLIGLRNVISHGYETIDREQIWQMIRDDLPAFVASLDRLDQR
jgi:uncharacterized protein with HEPN domain